MDPEIENLSDVSDQASASYKPKLTALTCSENGPELEIDASGVSEDETEYKSESDFFAVCKLPSEVLLKELETIFEATGWYNYLKQIHVSGSLMSPEEVIGKMFEI